MTATVRAALYLRVSTGRQADNDLSIPDTSAVRRKPTVRRAAGRSPLIMSSPVPPRLTIGGRNSSA